MAPFLRKGDFWSGLALAALGAWIVANARGWTYMGEDGPGAGFFPLWYGSLMLALSLALVALSVAGRSTGPERALKRGEAGRALACWGAFVATVALMRVVGFAPAFALLAWFMVAVMARRPQRVALPFAIGSALAFWLLFERLLDVTLPKGAFF